MKSNAGTFCSLFCRRVTGNSLCVSKVRLNEALIWTMGHRKSPPLLSDTVVGRTLDSFGATMFHLAPRQVWCLSKLANAERRDSCKRWSTGQTGHHLDTHTIHTQVIYDSKLVLLPSHYTLTFIKLGSIPIGFL